MLQASTGSRVQQFSWLEGWHAVCRDHCSLLPPVVCTGGRPCHRHFLCFVLAVKGDIVVELACGCVNFVSGDHRVRPQGRLADREKELGPLSARIFRPGSLGHPGRPPSGEFCHLSCIIYNLFFITYQVPGYHLSCII